jgi:hypothetical protein
MIIAHLQTAAATSLATPIQLQLKRLRMHLERAVVHIALEAQRIVFRCLSEIAIAAPVSESVLDALFGARQACLAFLGDLQRGQTSALKRRAALTSIDVLECALLSSRPATYEGGRAARRQGGES